jgi:hypothetical protein
VRTSADSIADEGVRRQFVKDVVPAVTKALETLAQGH